MRTIYIYITKQVLATLLLAVAVFTFVLLLGNVLKKIVPLLVNQQAPPALVLKALGLLFPYLLAFALPIGLLTAVLLFFGRFCADQELTALRSSGVSLLHVAFPVIALSLILSGICAAINLRIGPLCRDACKELIHSVNLQAAANWLTEGALIEEIPGYYVYIGKKSGDVLQEVRVFELSDDKIVGDHTAPFGRLDVDNETRRIQITLTNATGLVRHREEDNWQLLEVLGEWHSKTIQIPDRSAQRRKPKISHMTWSQLRAELNIRMSAEKTTAQSAAANLPAATNGAEAVNRKKVEIVTPVKVQIHHQIAFSFACFSFALVGIPLGILRSHWRNIGFSLLLLTLYYAFPIFVQSLEARPEWRPELIVWLPNFLFQGLGCFLLWKANRGI